MYECKFSIRSINYFLILGLLLFVRFFFLTENGNIYLTFPSLHAIQWHGVMPLCLCVESFNTIQTHFSQIIMILGTEKFKKLLQMKRDYAFEVFCITVD